MIIVQTDCQMLWYNTVVQFAPITWRRSSCQSCESFMFRKLQKPQKSPRLFSNLFTSSPKCISIGQHHRKGINTSLVAAYAYCAAGTPNGGVVVVLINFALEAASVALRVGEGGAMDVYVILCLLLMFLSCHTLLLTCGIGFLLVAHDLWVARWTMKVPLFPQSAFSCFQSTSVHMLHHGSPRESYSYRDSAVIKLSADHTHTFCKHIISFLKVASLAIPHFLSAIPFLIHSCKGIAAVRAC
jgi:hypothetical protein